MTQNFKVAVQPNLRDLVASKLRDMIETGHFQPGQRLVEWEICEMLGVSRAPLREALRELETTGLLTNIPNRGPIVSVVSFETFEAVQQVRVVLEQLVVRLFTLRAGERQLDELREAVDAIEVVYANFSGKAFLDAKAKLYAVLFAGADNPIAESMLRSLHSRISLLRSTSLGQPGRATKSLAEIRAMVEAIEARDPDLAAERCRIHLENAAEAAMHVLKERSEAGAPAKKA